MDSPNSLRLVVLHGRKEHSRVCSNTDCIFEISSFRPKYPKGPTGRWTEIAIPIDSCSYRAKINLIIEVKVVCGSKPKTENLT